MSEHSIRFNSDMIRAILAGHKTQTRRPVRSSYSESGPFTHIRMFSRFLSWMPLSDEKCVKNGGLPTVKCPYGDVGDFLWVKEDFAQHPQFAQVAYRADGKVFEDADGFTWRPKWIPDVYMPRKLSRITLVITDIHVEKLRTITSEEAILEGAYEVSRVGDGPASATWTMGASQEWRHDSPLQAFEALWDSIYARRGQGWDVNPWVWGIIFKRVED